MLTLLTLGALLASSSLVRADVNPTAPGPTDVYKEGGTCHIAWDPDTTGTWKVMNIELMTGSNLQMVHLTTVTTLDGTSTTVTTFDYPCPEVTPNSQIYFYQFTSPGANTTLWTTRFTIADASGASTPPTEATQPTTGEAIPWGTGALVNPADATPPPAGAPAAAAGNTTAPANTTASAPVVPATSSAAAVPAGQLPPAGGAPGAGAPAPAAASPSTSSSTAKIAAATPTGATAQSNGAGGMIVHDKIYKAVFALVAAAVTFTVAL